MKTKCKFVDCLQVIVFILIFASVQES